MEDLSDLTARLTFLSRHHGDCLMTRRIELLADGVSYFAFLNPGDAPEAEFCVKADKVTAREFCNKHGLWKAAFEG